jgi:hypothetical protein
MDYEIGFTYRTKCGDGRATYRPDWSASAPWVVYVRGSAKRHAQSLEDAKRYLRWDYGCKT